MSAPAPIVTLLINLPSTNVHHILKLGGLIALVVFILDNTSYLIIAVPGTLSFCASKRRLFIDMLNPGSTSFYKIDFKVFSFLTRTTVMAIMVFQTPQIVWISFPGILVLLQTPIVSPWYLYVNIIVMGCLYPGYNHE